MAELCHAARVIGQGYYPPSLSGGGGARIARDGGSDGCDVVTFSTTRLCRAVPLPRTAREES